jgi:DNA-binding transcriptional LysR family regulator
MINLRHIEVFHAVYTAGSVSGGAKILNVSQPSVTKVLKHAETILGFPLFDRTKGRLVATADADALFSEVSEIQSRVYALRQASKNLRQGRGSNIRLSVLPSLGLAVIPSAVEKFLKSYEGVFFDLQTVHHSDMVPRLYERETDIVISYEVPPSAPVSNQWIGEGEMVLLYREEEMPDAPRRLPLSALSGKPFISPMRSGPLGVLLAAELDSLDLSMDEVLSVRTFFVAAELVKAGVGWTIVDNFTAQAMVAPGISFRPLQPAITFDIHAIYLQDRPLSPTALAFLGTLSDVIAGS